MESSRQSSPRPPVLPVARHGARHAQARKPRAHPARPARFAGQSLVEFGLLSLLLMTLVAGIVDLGRGVYARTTLTNAVREAARYGATDPENSTGIITAATQSSAGVHLADTVNPKQSFADNGGVIRCTDRNYAWMPPAKTNTMLAPAALGLSVVAPALAQQLVAADSAECVSDFYFRVNGRLTSPPDQIPGSGIQGKSLSVTFVVSDTCTNVHAALTVWKTDENGVKVGAPYDDAQGGPYGAGSYILTLSIPNDPNYGYIVEFHITAEPTPSPTPVPPTATATNTPLPPTNTPIPTATGTATPIPPTNTPTNTPTVTPVPPTKTPAPPTNTPTVTSTPLPTNTPTVTPPPTSTPLPTNTPIPTATATATVVGGLGGTTFTNQRDARGRAIPQDCDYPRVGNLLTVCAQYDFKLALPSLIGYGNIPMKECASVDIQSVSRP